MSYGLKNAGATFQRCMQKCMQPQLGRNIHVYVDDIMVKTKQHLKLLDDLKGTFANLREYKVKLNPEKCVFGVPAGKLLGFLVSERGIVANRRRSRPSSACASRLGCAMSRSSTDAWPRLAGF